MENTEETYLANINEFVGNIVNDYPVEHLGVADKFILSGIIRKEGKSFGKNLRHYNFVKRVNDGMKRYGFIGREFVDI